MATITARPPGIVERGLRWLGKQRQGVALVLIAVAASVCALLAGGGYAEHVRVPAGQVLPVPDGVALVDAAALPEVACTVWSNVFLTANLQPGETILVSAAKAGIVIPSSCRQGLCATCRVTKLSGDAEMHQNGGLFDDEVEAGDILACCTYPRSPLTIRI